MKQCPRCNLTYDDTLNFCLDDGTPLSAWYNPEATWVMPQNQWSSPVEARRHLRTLRFSGYEWIVKSSSERVGPGPNYFSGSDQNVWLDELGKLHLRITYRSGKWHCAEIICTQSLAYGEYIFKLQSRIDVLDPNIVFALFIWDNTSPEENNREMDIEFSRWGDPKASNSQFVVQPSDIPNHVKHFDTKLNGDYTTHILDWTPEHIRFQSIHGHYDRPPKGYLIEEWVYRGSDISRPGTESVRMNLWLRKGKEPQNLNEAEVVIKQFKFLPTQESFRSRKHMPR